MHIPQLGMLFSTVMVAAFSGAVANGPAAWAESWKPALHDADELYDAAEDLHDRAQRLGDPRVIPVTASLEELTARLYHQLKHNACAADVVPLMETTGAVLDEAATLVTLSCEMRSDRKSLAELKNARRYFAATHQQIHCLVHHHGEAAGERAEVQRLYYGIDYGMGAPPSPQWNGPLTIAVLQPQQPPARGPARVLIRQF